jgi:hypothetical protein
VTGMKPSPDRDANRLSGTGRPPEYVVEAWVSHQLRDKIQHLDATLSGAEKADRQGRVPEPELEAEP